MAKRQLPDSETLNQLLRYDAATGKLWWRERDASMFSTHYSESACAAWNTRWAGKEAMSNVRPDGRLMGTVAGISAILAHRAIWCMAYGYWPHQVDHIDGDFTNNRLSNLREVSSAANAKNKRLLKINRSGCHGVSRSLCGKKWRVNIGIGTFETLEDAIAARRKAEEMLGYHPNHGRTAK